MSRSQGYSGRNYDRHVEQIEQSTLHKMKETFWTTKQAVIKKLGKKEDIHVVASDQELDSKLEVFKAIQRSSIELLKIIEKYQDRLCNLSQEENAMGRFLKQQQGHDKTRAGKMMAAVGKSQSFAAQQRLSLRVPLVRLYQEVETFRYRAVSDTLLTINRMEGARTEYRGALLWMKNVSEELDPDTYKQLEKFRKVQAQVRKSKAKFDKLKLDVMQKVDLLAASRCNMFSHVLANYQTTLLTFWEKTSRTMSAVAESFKGYQYYEFNMLKVYEKMAMGLSKELDEPSKKLAEETSKSDKDIGDMDDEEFDPENLSESKEESSQISSDISDNLDSNDVQPVSTDPTSIEVPVDRLIALSDEEENGIDQNKEENGRIENILDTLKSKGSEPSSSNKAKGLINFEDDTNHKSDNIEEEFTGALTLSKMIQSKKKESVPQDLITEKFEPEAIGDSDKDDMSILNDILNAPSGKDDFATEWQGMFGSTPLSALGAEQSSQETETQEQSSGFLPSNLLEMSSQLGRQSLPQGVSPGSVPMMSGMMPAGQAMMPGGPGMMPGMMPGMGPMLQDQTQASQPQNKPGQKQGQKKDMSAWFNLFADLDPLSNPDAIGKQMEDMTDA